MALSAVSSVVLIRVAVLTSRSAVEVLVAIMVEVVLVPVGIVKVNHAGVHLNALHLLEHIVGNGHQTARVKPIILLAAALGNIAQNPLLEAGSNLNDLKMIRRPKT